MVERILASSEFWTAVSAALVSFLGAWWLAYYNIRKKGIDTANAAEITDRAAFRKHIMDALAQSEKHHTECLEREKQLREQMVALQKRVAGLEKSR